MSIRSRTTSSPGRRRHPRCPLGLVASEAKWRGPVYDPDVVDLGRLLFNAKVLSENFQRRCTTCHVPEFGFAETLPLARDFSTTPAGSQKFNTPTVLNAAFGTHKFFDGRALTLEEQVLVPISEPSELNLDLATALTRLKSSNEWAGKFDDAFPVVPPDPDVSVTEANLATSLAMYIRTLNSGNSAFDQFEAGNYSALSTDARLGRALFFGKARCFHCHSGSSFSNDEFHNTRTVDATPTNPSNPVLGRGGFTGRVSEEGLLKVPTLRSIEKTGPYFHDGQAADLMDVILHYDRGGGSQGRGTRSRDAGCAVAAAGALAGRTDAARGVPQGVEQPVVEHAAPLGPCVSQTPPRARSAA